MSRRIKLTIEYDGSAYHGWQYQDNAISVQEELRDALYKLTGEDIIPEGAGRTDAGVHARAGSLVLIQCQVYRQRNLQ